MEPITTTIVAALTASLSDVTKVAVKDAYIALKTKIISLTTVNVAVAVKELESAPDSQGRQLVLSEELTKADIAEIDEIQELLSQLMIQLNKNDNHVPEKFNINAEKIGVVADKIQNLTQNF
ncbi:hypothetical protein [Paraglaciecola sp.]|uniref:hypothetical protein n=1 Tax=Paraglaciecola sp. TaxID=1920173 RepID=UPI0032644460